ncbi:MAG TPA: 50S ribosomal protein L10 [Flavobacteriales bacterium]|nr:50S ribosomal protein L10 [Flavobacteriales bacterium]
MNRDQKNAEIARIASELKGSPVFYLADTSTLTVEDTNALRRDCFNGKIKMQVVKNTLLKKALDSIEGIDYSEMYSALHGPTAILFAETGNAPAKLLKEFRKKNPKLERPKLKAAYVEESIYVGENQLDALANIKSKNELLGDVIALLQSPAKNVISALKSGGEKIAGIVKTLESRNA